jgi:GT2 family glycosyltransferase
MLAPVRANLHHRPRNTSDTDATLTASSARAADSNRAAIDVAVIIVSYKTALLVIEAVRSLLEEQRSTRLNIRAIVVDNASGDSEIIAREIRHSGWDSWVTLISAPFNGGFAYGNNLGIEYAHAQWRPTYVYLLNPDAQVRRGAIAALVKFLDGRPEAGIAGSSFENQDGSDWPIAFRFPSVFSEIDECLQIGPVSRLLARWIVAKRMGPLPEKVDWICGASMLIRPQVFAAIGGLDENYFLYFEETDFCRRARIAGFCTWYVPESRVMHITGQSTKLTDLTAGPKRLPSYWFDSRRRYFATAFGIPRAMALDFITIVAYTIGLTSKIILRKEPYIIPHFLRDFLRHSIILPRNREFAPLQTVSIEPER